MADPTEVTDPFEAVDDLVPGECMPLAYIRALAYIDLEGKRRVSVDWNADLDTYDLSALLGCAKEYFEMAADSEEDEE